MVDCDAGAMEEPSWAAVVQRVNQHLRCSCRLARPLSGGRQGGAWVVIEESEPTGAERVLKWTVNRGLAERREETAWLVERLRAHGYPTPRWHAWGAFDDGVAYVIADPFEGTTASWASLGVDTLIDAVERQADVARSGRASWSGYMHQALTSNDGPRGDIAALGHDGASFLHLIDAATASMDDLALPETDAVHGDLEAGNILVAHPSDPDSPIGIIDIDACGAGTRAIDYAWLVRDATTHHAPESTTSRLHHAGIAVAGPDVWAACVGFACLELVGFVARSGNQTGAGAEIRRLTPLLHAVSAR